MSTLPILQEAYRQHIDHFGDPTGSIVFDDGKQMSGFPERIDVFTWVPDAECDITTFATIGMAAMPMAGAEHRAELHFAVRRELTNDEIHKASVYLANLAMYPFYHSTYFDWWHTLSDTGPVPFYTEAQCILLHPRFVEDGWDGFETDGQRVKILNVVPVTRRELESGNASGILDRLDGIDIFTPR